MSAESEIDLAELLSFETEEGRIWLDDYRMVMLSSCALGVLRKELIETLGWEQARGALKRFGYAAGLADALTLSQRFPAADQAGKMRLGPELQALEGMAKVAWSEAPDDAGTGQRPCGDTWESSFEAEAHLDLFGRADEPVCWILAGYAAGHASAAIGGRVLVVERECRAMGHEVCRFVAARAEEDPELFRGEDFDYTPRHLPEELQRLQEEIEDRDKTIAQLRSEVAHAEPRGGFVGTSRALSKSLDTAQAVAPYSSSVLILGESGTGKELLARFVHRHSEQVSEAFIAVNCSALPETLQEAELFGYARGAFTGASSAQAGVFEAAHGGTLFLDEVGDLSLTAQTKILRALQEGEIKRLGETRTREARPRIIAATHQDLQAMVRGGTFREDLYYRLSVVVVHLPPLRERTSDVLLLAEHFMRLYAESFGKKVGELSHEAAFALLDHDWPGNVRELQNVIQRAVILASSGKIELEDLPEELARPASQAAAAERAEPPPTELEAVGDEGERLLRALELTDGNREQAAALLGISRTTLWRRMKALGVEPPA